MPQDLLGGEYAQAAGIASPGPPANYGNRLRAMLNWLAQTQWWEQEALHDYQMRELATLLRHARATVPFYRERLAPISAEGDVTTEMLRQLPLLTRRDVQNAGPALLSNALPPQLSVLAEKQTSGSTGEPVKVRCTALEQISWEAMTLRDHQWHRRDFAGKLASIRVLTQAGAPASGAVQADWGPPATHLHQTGPGAYMNMNTDVAEQARWLLEQDPDYLITYPTNLKALIAQFTALGARPQKLQQVRTIGETVTRALRSTCRNVLGASLVDVYSSQEIGTIALQCPVSGLYHVMAEDLLVEVLDDDGLPCEPGAVGRVVVTTLHNYAMPLIRYEVRDYAEAAAPCACGRGLPTLARILGRSRNLLTLPNGERHWPQVGFYQYREIAPIRQYQLVQHSLQDIEVRLVVDRSLSADEETRLAAVINTALGHEFNLRFVFFAGEIPRGAGGKFEEFVSLLPDESAISDPVSAKDSG